MFRDFVNLIFLVNKIISKNDIIKTKIAKLEKNICNLSASSWLKFSLGIIFGLAWLLVAIIFRYASLSSIIGSMSVWIYSIFVDNEIQSYLLFIIFPEI